MKNTKIKVIATTMPATALAIATFGTIFGSWGQLDTFKTTIISEGTSALSWVVSIVVWLIGLYLLPVILRYLWVITWSMRWAMGKFFWWSKKS